MLLLVVVVAMVVVLAAVMLLEAVVVVWFAFGVGEGGAVDVRRSASRSMHAHASLWGGGVSRSLEFEVLGSLPVHPKDVNTET